jgi:ABC-type uncharacterized transport system permease subunit
LICVALLLNVASELMGFVLLLTRFTLFAGWWLMLMLMLICCEKNTAEWLADSS